VQTNNIQGLGAVPVLPTSSLELLQSNATPSISPQPATVANDQVSISAAAQALQKSEINEAGTAESSESMATQIREGEAAPSLSKLDVLA